MRKSISQYNYISPNKASARIDKDDGLRKPLQSQNVNFKKQTKNKYTSKRETKQEGAEMFLLQQVLIIPRFILYNIYLYLFQTLVTLKLRQKIWQLLKACFIFIISLLEIIWSVIKIIWIILRKNIVELLKIIIIAFTKINSQLEMVSGILKKYEQMDKEQHQKRTDEAEMPNDNTRLNKSSIFTEQSEQIPQSDKNNKNKQKKVEQNSDLQNDSAQRYSVMYDSEKEDDISPTLLCKVKAILEIGASSSLQIYNIQLYSNSDLRIISLYNRQFEKHKLKAMRSLHDNYYLLQFTDGERKIKFREKYQHFKKYLIRE